MLGGEALGGGFVSRAVSYAAGLADARHGQAAPAGALGGRSTENTQSESPPAGKIRTAAAAAGMAATGGDRGRRGAAATSGGAGAAAGADGRERRGGQLPASGRSRRERRRRAIRGRTRRRRPRRPGRRERCRTGSRRRRFNEERHFDDEMDEAEYRGARQSR